MKSKNFSILGTFKVFYRWPVFFLVPLVVVAVYLAAFTLGVKLYKSSGIVLFQSGYIPVEEHFTLLDKNDGQPTSIIRSLLYGDAVSSIVESVWPEAKENEVFKNSKVSHLRSRNGVKLKFQRDNPQAVSISYESSEPELSFKVVNFTIKTLIEFNRSLTEEKIDSAITFLSKELEKSKDDLAELEQKIVRVRSGLPLDILESHDKRTADIEEILDLLPVDYDIEKNLAKALKFEESAAELSYELEIAKKELTKLKSDLKDKSFLDNPEGLELVLNASKDSEVTKISNLILTKEQKINELESQGFLTAHPEMISVNKEIDNLRKMKTARLLELQKSSSTDSEELTHLRLEKLQLKKIDDKKIEIQRIQDRIKATNAYHEKFGDKDITLDDKLKELSERKASLIELENKKLVVSHSYAQMAKRLEVLKREGRVDQEKFGLTIKVAESPKIPTNHVPYAGLPTILLGTVITAVILFGIASLMSYFDSAVYTQSHLRSLVGVPVIGVIDSFRTQEEQQKSLHVKKRVLLGLLIYSVVVFLYFTIF